MLRAGNISKSTSPAAPFSHWLTGSGEEEFSTHLWIFLCASVKILLSSCFSKGSSPDAGRMASAHDRAVLQAIFNPSSPFGSSSGLVIEEESHDNGESVSTHHVTAFFGGGCLSFHGTFAQLENLPFLGQKTKKINKINMTF